MTARGVLYIEEECRDVFEVDLNEEFGEGKWRLDGDGFRDTWDMSQFPEFVDVMVRDRDTDEIIGIAIIESRFFVDEVPGVRFIQIEPAGIEIKSDKNV